jgi:hypothetical protein
MSTTSPTAPLRPSRAHALAGGILYLITFSSIPIGVLYAGIRQPGFITGDGPDLPIIVGGLLEIIVALACIGTAVALYPVIKRQGESVALGFVGARVFEAGTIFAGVAALLTLVSLRQADLGTDALITEQALTGLHRWLQLGQALTPVINAVLLGTLLYRSRLVPRVLPIIGLIGAPLLLVSTLATLFGVWPQFSPIAGLAALPIAVWEFSLGLYLVVKGFRRVPIAEAFDAERAARA